ncbi:MAG: hypothetical protein BWY06_02795 [Candidatus Latescibacteria bacterium ADurb.Bin168]|nr:MAG: hypothetical protein BWY06_02795 [Candidatus Latescibacteria bacterium ADurb.Bin168]
MTRQKGRCVWQNEKDHQAPADEHKRFVRERGENQAKGKHRSEIVDEAGTQNPLPELRPVESGFQHDCVDYCHRGGGEGDSRQQAGPQIPPQSVMCHQGTADKGRQKTDKSDDRYFPELGLHHFRFEFRTRQKREKHGAGGREEFEPFFVVRKRFSAPEMCDYGCRSHSHTDFHQRDGYFQVVCQHGRDNRQEKPDGGMGEQGFHESTSQRMAMDKKEPPERGKEKTPAGQYSAAGVISPPFADGSIGELHPRMECTQAENRGQ